MAHTPTTWRQAGPWLAIATAPATLMLGGGVAEQMAFSSVVLALALGTGVLWVLSTLQGRLGAIHRQPLVKLARPVLGTRVARWTNSLLISILMIGWTAFGIGVAGESLAELSSTPEWLAFPLWALVLVLGLWQGIQRASLIALLSSLATLALMAWGVWQVQHVGQVAEPHPPQGTLMAGVGLVVGYGAAFSLRCVDFTHFARTRQVPWISMFGLCLPLFVVALAGAWLYEATGTWDLSQLLKLLGFPAIAQLFIMVGFLGAGVSNMHSGSLALQDLLRCSRESALLVMSVVGVGLAAWGFEEAMVLWLRFLGIVVVPLIGVMLCHYSLRANWVRPINWMGLGAWGLGVLAGLFSPRGVPSPVLGVLAAAACYALFNHMVTRRRKGAWSSE